MDQHLAERPTVRILGTHGVPAAYGGFETAAEQVARFLVARGWRTVVYCQTDHGGPMYTDVWEGIERVNISVPDKGWLGTSKFDWLSIRDAVRHRDLCLTFGYNTAVFNVRQRVRRIPNVINMDGIEWSRERWGPMRQAILWTNERIGCWVGDDLIADHPELEVHLRTRAPARKITTITYGADTVTDADPSPLAALGLEPGAYLTLIARPIPENSILELVRGFSTRPRGVKLVLLGNYDQSDDYHREVLASASEEVAFPGAIYDPEVVQSLRFHALGYLHGHTVGGTNPSLVEALGAGNAVIAHDNKYNRWVAGAAATYFRTEGDVDAAVSALLDDPGLRQRQQEAARKRHAEEFTWDHVAGQYEDLLLRRLEAHRRGGR